MTDTKKPIKIRLGSFDFIKGFAIIAVVLSHTLGRYSADSVPVIQLLGKLIFLTGRALMPMFFIISGYMFREKPIRKMLKRTFSELLVPYLIITAAYAVLYPIFNYPAYHSWKASFARSSQFVAAFLLGWAKAGEVVLNYELAWCTAAWFFLALFVVTNAFNLILKLKNTKLIALFVILSVLFSHILIKMDFFFFCAAQGLLSVSYCYLGYILKKRDILSRLIHSPWAYIILIPIYWAEYKWGAVDLSQGVYENLALELIGSGLSGLLLIMIGIRISLIQSKLVDWLSYIGFYTYWVIAIHAIEMEVIPWYFMPLRMPDHLLLAFCIEILIKITLMVCGCLLLKQITKLNYKRRLARHGQSRIHS